MISREQSPPIVLVFSAHDPTGAAGLQADIESITQNGGRCISVLTAVTAQNTTTFDSILPQSPLPFRNQLDLLVADIPVDSCKIGLAGSELLIHEISGYLQENDHLPVVLDPVLQAGTGTNLDNAGIKDAILKKLVPLSTVMTPNLKEAIRLTGKNNRDTAAACLLDMGCRNVLITGADQSTKDVINVLYTAEGGPVEFAWERLPGTYHGSGCTLASSIAIFLARNQDVVNAVKDAQEYTWNALKKGIQLGRAQIHPTRNF